MRSRTCLLALLLCSLLASSAVAQPASEPSPEDISRAEALSEEAEGYYNIGEHEKAVEGFKEAYLLSRDPALLFNLGQCYRHLGRYKEALYSFQRFLDEAPETPLRSKTEALIAQCQARVPPEEEPDEPEEPASTLPAPEEGAFLEIRTRGKGRYTIQVETLGGVLRCEAEITRESPCRLVSVPPGKVQILVEGSRRLRGEVVVPTGGGVVEIGQRGYGLVYTALSAPVAIFALVYTVNVTDGVPGLDSLGIGAASGVVTALLVTSPLLLLDRFAFRRHKSLKLVLGEDQAAAAKAPKLLGVGLGPAPGGGVVMGASFSF